MRPPKCDRSGGKDGVDKDNVLDPENRVPAQQHIPDCAAAHGRDRCQHQHAQQVKLRCHPGKGAAGRKNGHTKQIEQIQE